VLELHQLDKPVAFDVIRDLLEAATSVEANSPFKRITNHENQRSIRDGHYFHMLE
jgi:hypothetical protein